jgi:hypothetical protein
MSPELPRGRSGRQAEARCIAAELCENPDENNKLEIKKAGRYTRAFSPSEVDYIFQNLRVSLPVRAGRGYPALAIPHGVAYRFRVLLGGCCSKDIGFLAPGLRFRELTPALPGLPAASMLLGATRAAFPPAV